MAPQSSTTNGLRLRGEAWWMPRAIISLPVPVSPVTSTVSSDGATFSSVAKISRMRTEAPVTLSKVSRLDSGISTMSCVGTKRSVVCPTRNSCPGLSHTSRMRSSPTKVPLVESRSRRR